MICGACGNASGGVLECEACGAKLVVEERYRLEAILHQVGETITYGATRLGHDQPVVVTATTLEGPPSSSMTKRFEEQAQALRRLDHPGIPTYVDHLMVTEALNTRFYLIHEVVEGVDLASESEERFFLEREAVEMLAELLEVLEHCHQQPTPVIHGALNPQNIRRQKNDGRLVLMGFGNPEFVLGERARPLGAKEQDSPYRAPEQGQGGATSGSDLYALGALAVSWIADDDPGGYLDEAQRWRSDLDVEPPTARLLDELLNPDPSQRARDAAALRPLVTKVLEALSAEEQWTWDGAGETSEEEESFRGGERAYRIAIGAALAILLVLWGVGFMAGLPWPMVIMLGGAAAFLMGMGLRIVIHAKSVIVADEGPGYSIQRRGKSSDGYLVLGMGVLLAGGMFALAVFGDFDATESESGETAVNPANENPDVIARWPGRVTAVEGHRLGVGAPCEVIARFKKVGAKLRAVVDVECEGRPLYDWNSALQGAQKRTCNVWEGTADTLGATYNYRLRCHDVGVRTGGRPQMTIDNYARKVRVFHDIPPAFSVKIEVDEYSQPHRGKPIFDGNTAKDPGFVTPVLRKGPITYRSGPTPAVSAKTCTVQVFPIPTVSSNCRVEVTCGDELIYGVQGGGFAQCSVQGGRPIVAHDGKGSVIEGDFMLDMNLDTGRVVVSDDAPGATWRIEVNLQ